MKLRSVYLTLALACTLHGHAWAQEIYDEDLTWHLANPGEIHKVTTIKARLKREVKEAPPLFILTPPPFEDIQAAPNSADQMTRKPDSWDVPPWPSVDPPLPADATPAERLMYERRKHDTAEPEVWPELDSPGGEKERPSPLLRPRVVPLDQQFVFRVKEIPKPFSLRRYFDNEDTFFQVAAYGGTTSFKAEEAFRAIKEAATRQTKLEGIGDEAFMTRVEITEKVEDPNALPFADVEVKGEARPDLTDSGRAEALLAPAFQDIAVKDLEGHKVTFVDPYKKYSADHPKVLQSLLVLVAYFPDEAVTVSFAMDEKLGTIQDLIAVAMMAQRKLKEEIKAH